MVGHAHGRLVRGVSTLLEAGCRRMANLQNEKSKAEAEAGFSIGLADQVQLRKQEKSRAKRRKIVRVAVAVLLALLLLTAVAFAAAWNMLKSGERNLVAQPTDVATAESAVSYDEGRTIQHNGSTYVLNENMVSVCLIGIGQYDAEKRTGRAGEADAVMVLAFDTETGEAVAVSIPRDSFIDAEEYVGSAFLGMSSMQLCLAYSYGDGAHSSCENVISVVQRVLYNMPVNYYFAVDMDGVGPMANAIGGVSLTALESIPNTYIREGDSVVLHDKDALRYVRHRDKSRLDSSLLRQQRQMQFLEAYAAQALEAAKSDFSVLTNLYETGASYSVTNLGLNEFAYLASCMTTNGITSLEVITLQGELIENNGYAEYHLDKESVYQTVLDVYYTKVEEHQAS